MLRVAVDVGGVRIVCEVARTAAEQARGLQGHPGIRDGTGMFFPFHPPRGATFHMGTVAFPIDLVFADASGRVGRIVHGAMPGERATWTHPVVGAVMEVPGGWCRRSGLVVGHVLRVAGRKLGAQTYNILRTLTEAAVDADADADAEAAALGEPRGEEDEDGFDVHATPPLQDGYYSKEPLHAPPDFGGERDDLAPGSEDEGWPSGGDRWNDRVLPDRGPDAMNQPDSQWSRAMPYVTPLDAPEPPGGTRMGALEVALEELVPRVLAGAVRAGIPWETVVLNDKRERAVITPTVMGHWLHALGLSEETRSLAHEAAVSEQALDALATAMISEKMADTANIAHLGDQNILVVERRKQPWT